MNTLSPLITLGELQQAANYFSGLKFKPWVKVIEADNAPPLTYETGFPIPHRDQPSEPLAGRIVELSNDQDRSMLRDPDVGFTALVPRGAIARGRQLVKTGGPAGIPCATCHGVGLRGGQGATAPPIAGRSPTYMARALYDFAHGARNDASAQPMKPVAQKLSLAQMVSVVAYVASLKP